ncbi:type 4a pilus biogenesis protein PilO [Candidatus Hydrogenedentota bacterium]
MARRRKLSFIRVNILGGIFVVLLATVVFTSLVGGGLKKKSELEIEQTRLTEELNYLTELAASLGQGEGILESLEERIRELDERLPTEMNFEGFLLTLNEVARENDILVSEVRPGPFTRSGKSTEMLVNIVVMASFEDFHPFMYTLSNLPRLTKLDSLVITASENSHLCDIDMSLKIYSADPMENEDAG